MQHEYRWIKVIITQNTIQYVHNTSMFDRIAFQLYNNPIEIPICLN